MEETKYIENAKLLLLLEIILGSISTMFYLLIIFLMIYAINNLIWQIISFTIASILFIIGIIFCLLIEQKTGYYQCQKCQNKYIPKFKQIILAPHIGRTRHMKCPKCKEKSWQKKVL